MRKILIKGGKKLKGKIHISGAKNASLPILISTLLINDKSILSNVPNVYDVTVLRELLSVLGSKIKIDENGDFIVDNSNIVSTTAPKEIVNKFRASFLVLGALLTKFKKCKVAMPGGCKIGARPVDIYIETMKQMGADIEETEDYIIAKCEKLIGTDITLRLPSVGATQNLIMAATLAEGETIIRNAAREPEVADLCKFLVEAGAKISGIATNIIKIQGVNELKSTKYNIMADRIEAFSYIISALITDGDITLEGLNFYDVLENPINTLINMGANIQKINDTTIRVIGNKAKISPAKIKTDFYPGFPTDCQAPIMALMATINGVSEIDETIYENRFMQVAELNKMSANITTMKKSDKENIATINGKMDVYCGADVVASDIRGGMSLVLAGLAAKNETTIDNITHIERGYENLIDKLSACGAKISIINV